MSKNNEFVTLSVIEADGQLVALHDGTVFPPVQNNPLAGAKKITTPPVPTWTDNGYNWAYWGHDDRLPTNMREKMELVPIAGATIKKKAEMMAGNGLVYYRTADLAKGPNVERAYVQEIEDWMAENYIETDWWLSQCIDYCLPFNCFSEMVLSNDRRRITNLHHISAEHARLSKANPKTNQLDWLYYSYHFPFGTANTDNIVPLPLMRKYAPAAFFDYLRGNKFAWHSAMRTPGMIYYARPFWYGLFKDNGWLDVSSDVPRIVAAMQRNQVTLKYLINIPLTYFTNRYQDFPTYDDKKKQEVIDAKVLQINQYLTGPDSVFKSLANVFQEDYTGKQVGKIEIVPVDDKARTDTWVPSSNRADTQIVLGMGLHPGQIGLSGEGGNLGAGSGSSERETYNLAITLNTPDQTVALSALNFVSRYNGWGVTFAVDHTHHTTTNQQETGLAPGPRTTQVQPAPA